jgi:hypothetical protein
VLHQSADSPQRFYFLRPDVLLDVVDDVMRDMLGFQIGVEIGLDF